MSANLDWNRNTSLLTLRLSIDHMLDQDGTPQKNAQTDGFIVSKKTTNVRPQKASSRSAGQDEIAAVVLH